jgi:hypothetical protein
MPPRPQGEQSEEMPAFAMMGIKGEDRQIVRRGPIRIPGSMVIQSRRELLLDDGLSPLHHPSSRPYVPSSRSIANVASA